MATFRSLISGLWVVLLFLISIHLQPVQAEELGNSDLTACARSCLEQTLIAADCNLTIPALACQCSDTTLEDSTRCMITECKMSDNLNLFKVQAGVCDLPSESRATSIIVGGTFLILVSVALTALRLYGKHASKRLGWDDALLTVACVLSVICAALSIYNATQGWGTHMWDLKDGQVLAGSKVFFISQTIFPWLGGILKISIVMIYIQIFPQIRFRYACWAVIAFVLIGTCAVAFIGIFTCQPVASFWDKDIQGQCMSPLAVNGAGLGMGLLHDAVIIVLPIHRVRKLQMKRRRKIFVMLMFSLGFLGCIAAVMRLVDFMKTPTIVDPTWDYAGMVTWSGIEIGITFLCACLPTIKVMLAVLKPRWFADGSTKPSYKSPKNLESAESGESNLSDKERAAGGQLPSLHLTNLHQWSATRTNWDWKREDIQQDTQEVARDAGTMNDNDDDDDELETFITSNYRGASHQISPSRPAPVHKVFRS